MCPPVVSYALAAFLWACFQMHFKGDLALRLLIASALFVFVSVLNLLALLVQKFKYDLALRLLIASALFVFVSVLVLSLLALLVQKYKY